MTVHTDAHDPILDPGTDCDTCNSIRRRTFNALADLDLSPQDTDALLAKMREIAAEVTP